MLLKFKGKLNPETTQGTYPIWHRSDGKPVYNKMAFTNTTLFFICSCMPQFASNAENLPNFGPSTMP